MHVSDHSKIDQINSQLRLLLWNSGRRVQRRHSGLTEAAEIRTRIIPDSILSAIMRVAGCLWTKYATNFKLQAFVRTVTKGRSNNLTGLIGRPIVAKGAVRNDRHPCGPEA